MKRKEKIRHSQGYVLVFRPEHPHASADGYVPEHRLVMEKQIARYVDPTSEHVHHKDKNKANNDPSNLELLNPKDHARTDHGWKKIEGRWFKTCTKCDRFMDIEKNFYRRRSLRQEFVAHCKECVCRMRRNYRLTRGARRREVACIVCSKVFLTENYKRTRSCSRTCVWALRKRGVTIH